MMFHGSFFQFLTLSEMAMHSGETYSTMFLDFHLQIRGTWRMDLVNLLTSAACTLLAIDASQQIILFVP